MGLTGKWKKQVGRTGALMLISCSYFDFNLFSLLRLSINIYSSEEDPLQNGFQIRYSLRVGIRDQLNSVGPCAVFSVTIPHFIAFTALNHNS